MAARFAFFGLLTSTMATQPYAYSISNGKSSLYGRGPSFDNDAPGPNFTKSKDQNCHYVSVDESWGYECDIPASNVSRIVDSTDVSNGLKQVAIAVGSGLAGAAILTVTKSWAKIMEGFENGGAFESECVGNVRNYGSNYHSCSKKVMVAAPCDYVFDAEAGLRCLGYAGNALSQRGAETGCFRCSFHPGEAASSAAREIIYVKMIGGDTDGDPCDLHCGDYNVIYDH